MNFDWLGSEDAGGLNQEDAREALAKNEEMQKEAAQRMRDYARLFWDVFSVGRGPELLDTLRQMTIELSLMNVADGIMDGQQFNLDPANWAYHRNGQNSVVRHIEAMCRLAKVVENEETKNV